MSSYLTVKTKLNDKQYLVAALKKAIKDIFPAWDGEVQVAPQGQKLTLQGHGDKPGDIRISKSGLENNTVVLVTKDGQRVVYKNKQEAEADAKRRNISVDKIVSSPWIYADMGYAQQKDGTFTKIVSDVDQGTYPAYGREKEALGLFGPEFDKRVQAYYNGMRLLKQAMSKGAKTSNLNVQSVVASRAEIEVELTDEMMMQLARQQQVQYQPKG